MLKNIGFLGLGTVGKHMATNLFKGNYDLTVYDSDPAVVAELIKAGAKGAGQPVQRSIHSRHVGNQRAAAEVVGVDAAQRQVGIGSRRFRPTHTV